MALKRMRGAFSRLSRLWARAVLVGLTIFAGTEPCAIPSGAVIQTTAPHLLLHLDRYDIAVRVSVVEGKADVQATLGVRNASSHPLGRMVLRIGEGVEIKEVIVGGTAVRFSTMRDDVARVLTIVSWDVPEALAPGATTQVVMRYGLTYEEATARAAIMPDECLLLPESFWFPMIHTPFQVDFNGDTAPVTLTITVPSTMEVVAPGTLTGEKPEGDQRTVTFSDNSFGQPMMIARDFEAVAGARGAVSFYLPRGFTLTDQKTLELIAGEIERILDFYRTLFGSATEGVIRVAASSEVAAYGNGGLLILDERAFGRKILDEDTIFFLAQSLARRWLSARVRIEGTGHAILSDGLPSYVAMLYLEHRFGSDGLRRAVDRFRRAYASLVTGGTAYDAPLLRQTLLNRQYYTSVYNKTPLVLRLIEKRLGRPALLEAVKTLFSQSGSVVTYDQFQRALLARGSEAEVMPLITAWFGDVILPDVAVGKPIEERGKWTVQVANFGSGDLEVEVELVTDDGQRRRQMVKVEAQGYGQAVFTIGGQPLTVTVDPDRLYLQADYSNDEWPRRPPVDKLVSQGIIALTRSELAEAEAKLREAVTADPSQALARAAYARALALRGRFDEAEAQARQALHQEPVTMATYASASLALGEVLMGKNQPGAAADYFRQATLTLAEEAGPLLAARDRLIRAETAAERLPTGDRSLREFLSQFDSAVSSGRPAAVRDVVTSQNLKRFITGVTFLKSWKSEVLRAEPLDRNRWILDVRITALTGTNVERQSRAVYILRRRGNSWVVDDIPVFLER